MFAKAVALAALLTTTFAGTLGPIHTRSLLPNVTIKALPAGCASYPGYNADTNTAGPWSLTVSDSENPDLNNFGPMSAYSLAVGSRGPVMRWGYVSKHDIVATTIRLRTTTNAPRADHPWLPFRHRTHSIPMLLRQTRSPRRHQRQRCRCTRERKVHTSRPFSIPIRRKSAVLDRWRAAERVQALHRRRGAAWLVPWRLQHHDMGRQVVRGGIDELLLAVLLPEAVAGGPGFGCQ